MGASVWLGGHLVLAFSYLPQALKTRDVSLLQNFESKFERIGIPALLLQIITGLWISYLLVPHVSEWFNLSEPISRAISSKLALLGLTAILAVDARLRVIPKLKPENIVDLAWHIIPVTVIAVLFAIVGISIRFGGF
jgi:putative copper export protein